MSKKFKSVIPQGTKIQLEIPNSKIGALKVNDGASVQEYAKVVAVGDKVKGINKGDFILFKAWAIDFVTYEGETYYFIDIESNGVCAVVK